jgi:ABC-type Fe3+-hydroxamate transport system substrate-binding protein
MKMNLIDAANQTHRVVQSTPRIVSLVPSLTELLCDLGLAPYLVGRTGFCIHPAHLVASIPKMGGTKDVNIEKIRRSAATHLLVNIDENEKPTVQKLSEFIPNVIVTHPINPHDNLHLYQLLGGIFNANAKAEALCMAFEEAYAVLQQGLKKGASQQVLYCIWKDPWMSVAPDTYIAQMLAQIGWQQWQFPNNEARYPSFSWEQIPLAQIDRILLSSEPYRFSDVDCASLSQRLAVFDKPVQLLDGEMMSWYGSRAIAGLQYLARLR